mmetsp:Transcript_11649/g.23515  ORF Transcript_11649/g.23515 Transcript_11649/m.23515 type:complete len:644 (+) Transcript_11649:94-2025(+)
MAFRSPRSVHNPFREPETEPCLPSYSTQGNKRSRLSILHVVLCVVLVAGCFLLFDGTSNVSSVPDVDPSPKYKNVGNTFDIGHPPSSIETPIQKPTPAPIPPFHSVSRPVVVPPKEDDDASYTSKPQPTERPPVTPSPTPKVTAAPVKLIERQGHAGHPLPTKTLKKISLWLDSKETSSISTSSDPTTLAWEDMNMGIKKYDFTSLSPSRYGSKSKLEEAKKAFVTSYDKATAKYTTLPDLEVTSYVPSQGSSSLSFPGPLKSSNFALQYTSTLVFVLNPTVVHYDATVPGTEFFAYGNTKFSIDRGMVAFTGTCKKKETTVIHMTQSKGHIEAGETIVLAYRLNGDKVSMSLNGSPFEDFPSKHVFEEGKLQTVLGGGSDTSSFVGEIMEVMVLDEPAVDALSNEILNSLATKWDIPGMKDDVDVANDQRLKPAKGFEDETVESSVKSDHIERPNPKPDELTDIERKELEKKMVEERHKRESATKAKWLMEFDQLHDKAVEEAKTETEKEVEKVKREGVPPSAEDVWTVERAKKFVPGGCKGGDSYKDVPIRVYSIDKKSDTYVSVMWPPPDSAEMADVNKFTNAYKDSMKKITKLRKGGDELTGLVRDEIQSLKELRHSLFCNKHAGGDEGDNLRRWKRVK